MKESRKNSVVLSAQLPSKNLHKMSTRSSRKWSAHCFSHSLRKSLAKAAVEVTL